MGNCLRSCAHCQEREEEGEIDRQQPDSCSTMEGGFEKSGYDKGGFRVKILLTKEELEMLMFQLKVKGGRSLEDLLVEIERGREKSEGWKPSLESIMEVPEVQSVETGR